MTIDFDKLFRLVEEAGYQGVYYRPGFHVVNMFVKVKAKREELELKSESLANLTGQALKAALSLRAGFQQTSAPVDFLEDDEEATNLVNNLED